MLLEVLAPLPADFRHCRHCELLLELADVGTAAHRQMTADFPPELLEEADRLADWLQDLADRYGPRLRIRVWDPQSLPGLGRSLRYGIRRYPAFIVNRRHQCVGWDHDTLECALEQEVAAEDTDRGEGAPGSRQKIRAGLRRAGRIAGEIFYGMTVFDWVRSMRQERGEIERLFVLITFGDLMGLPLLPPYYTLRLLPYMIPTIHNWRRCILRERDWSDLAGLID